MFPKSALLFSVLAALSVHAFPVSPRAGGFQLSNGQAAQALNAQFATLTANSACQDGTQACVGGQFAQCVGGKFAVTGCAGGTQCFALPLVNKAGTSVTCDTEADAVARIAATGATGGLTGDGGAAAAAAGAGAKAGNNNAGAGGAAGAATVTAAAAAADATASAIAALSAEGSLPPVVNQAASVAIAGAAADAAKEAAGAAAAKPTAAAPANNNAGGAAAGAAAAAPPAATAAAGDFHLANGQDAQALNKQFATLTANSACQDGTQACVGGQFAQCVGGKFAITGCAGGLQCFALPLVNKKGTSVTCDTQADALARIAQTGATGGLTGA